MSCNKTAKQLQEKISNSDSIAINFFKGDGTMDTVVALKVISYKAVIEKLTGFISSASTAIKNDCGNDGSIHYFKNNMVIQDINFRMNNDDCRQFSFKLDGQYEATKLSAEAREFIAGLKK
jgi:hypothetical protein